VIEVQTSNCLMKVSLLRPSYQSARLGSHELKF
jgi:hypothetical protein